MPTNLKVAFFLAYRLLQRSRLSMTLIQILMVVLVYLNLLFSPALLNGLIQTTNNKLINTYSGQVIVQPANGQYLINNVDQLDQQIKGVDSVNGVSPHLQSVASIRSGNYFGSWEIDGVDPDLENQLFAVKHALVEGSYLNANDQDQILLGLQIAGSGRADLEYYSDSLRQVHTGDKVDVTFANGLSKEFTVKGIFYQRFLQADDRAYLPYKTMSSILGINDSANSIDVKLNPTRSAKDVAEELSFVRSGLRVSTWQDKAGIIKNVTESFQRIDRILQILALAVAALAVYAIFYIDVFRRRRIIGFKRAIGITRSTILLSFLIRALVIAIVGGAVAIGLFLTIIVPIQNHYPFVFPIGLVYLVYNPVLLAYIALILIGVTSLAALLASWRAISLSLFKSIWASD